MKKLLPILFIILCTTAHAALTLTQVDREHVLVRFDDAPNVAAYNFTLVGGKICDAIYQGAGNKTVEYNERAGKAIVYGLNSETVGDGALMLEVKTWGSKDIEITDSAAATPNATNLEHTRAGKIERKYTTITRAT